MRKYLILVGLIYLTFQNSHAQKFIEIQKEVYNPTSKTDTVPLHYFTLDDGTSLNGSYKIIWFRMDNGIQYPSYYTMCTYKDGYRNSMYEVYNFRSNRLFRKTEYCMGTKCGLDELYSETGKVQSRQYYNAIGQLHGTRSSWYERTGFKMYDEEFKNGIKHGKNFDYHMAVEVVSYETDYVAGKIHGELKGYDKQGKLNFVQEYKEGKEHGKYTGFSKHGSIESETSFVEGKRHGVSRSWWSDVPGRVLKSEYTFKMGKLHGIWREYFRDGSLSEERYFLDDMRVTKDQFEKSR